MAVRKRGTIYYAVWRDPAGRQRSKSCGPGPAGRKLATQLCERIKAEIVMGCYDERRKKTWSDFRAEYERVKQPNGIIRNVLKHFERICRPGPMAGVDAKMIDEYVAVRRGEPGRKECKIAASTINKELAVLRAVLGLAKRWEHIERLPDITFLKVHEDEPVWVPPENFARLYQACDAASRPDIPNVAVTDWWRAFLLFQYLTGWRVGQVLAIQSANVDFEHATVLSPWAETKGRRSERIPVHEVLLQHLEPLKACRMTSDRLFPWTLARSGLYDELRKIEERSGLSIKGFHSLRRSFATNNAANMDLFELQGLMCHRSLRTTKRYVAMAGKLNRSVPNIVIPNLEKQA